MVLCDGKRWRVCLCVCGSRRKKSSPAHLAWHVFSTSLAWCVHARSEGGDLRPVDTTKCALCKIWLNMLNIFQLFCMSTGHRFHPEPVLNWLAVTRILTWIPTVVVLKWCVQLTRTGHGVNHLWLKRQSKYPFFFNCAVSEWDSMLSQGHLDALQLKPARSIKGLYPWKDRLLVLQSFSSLSLCKNLGRNRENSLSGCGTDVLKNYKCSQTQRLEPGQTDNFMD